MICISKNCRDCRSHFTKQEIYRECYSDTEFIANCEEYERLQELRKTNNLACAKGKER